MLFFHTRKATQKPTSRKWFETGAVLVSPADSSGVQPVCHRSHAVATPKTSDRSSASMPKVHPGTFAHPLLRQ